MENTLAIILMLFIVFVCFLVAAGNLFYRHRRRKELTRRMKELESLKEQGAITEEQFKSLKNRIRQQQEQPVESCTLSEAEIIEAIEAVFKQLNELERNSNYTGDEKWARVFGIQAPLNLNLKELTLLSMKLVKPRKAIHIMAEILAMNIPVDALEIIQKQGKTSLPRYEAIAQMIWVQTRERLSEPISIRKEEYEKRKVSEQSLLAEMVPMIMKALSIPITASGFAIILALMVAKVEFNAFSDEDS